MMKLFQGTMFVFFALLCSPLYLGAQAKPNVLILYTDDVGYADLSCNGATDVQTPNIDWLAHNGLNFTDAHCTASTCTPSRYSLVSGKYAWRQDGTNILPGNAGLVIPTNIMTMPKVFQQAGYMTAVVGKWHLGLGDSAAIDWNKRVTPGPKEVGFDYSFIFPATADRTPTVFMEDQLIVGLDKDDPIEVNYSRPYPNEILGKDHPELLKMKSSIGHNQHLTNGIGRIGYMQGGTKAIWTDEELGFTFNTKAIEFIDNSKKANKPFFLYYAIHDIHAPRMPSTMFRGKSKLGYRGEAILEMDHSVGVIINALRERGLLDNTLIIFSSDNGPVLNDGYADNSQELATKYNYKPGGIYRGGKYSALEAGTRVPMLVYWKGTVKPNSTSNALVSQVDYAASFASMLGLHLPANSFADSKDYFTTIIGKQNISRDYITEQPANKALAIVKDGWKYISPSNGLPLFKDVNIESGYSSEDQLYDLKNDPSELKNLASTHPAKLEELKKLLKQVMKAGN